MVIRGLAAAAAACRAVLERAQSPSGHRARAQLWVPSSACPAVGEEHSGVWGCYRNTNTRLTPKRDIHKVLEMSEPTLCHHRKI